MPVYMFSFHAYRSWMPDHPRGYTKRREGYRASSEEMGDEYRKQAKDERSWFDPNVQKGLIATAIGACGHIKCHLHGAATERGHTHFVISWKHARTWLSMRTSVRTALTKFLYALHPGTTFSRGSSRKRVKDRKHLDYLIDKYLPDHPGWGWYEDRGWVRPRSGRTRDA